MGCLLPRRALFATSSFPGFSTPGQVRVSGFRAPIEPVNGQSRPFPREKCPLHRSVMNGMRGLSAEKDAIQKRSRQTVAVFNSTSGRRVGVASA